jgi:hypothetical protein
MIHMPIVMMMKAVMMEVRMIVRIVMVVDQGIVEEGVHDREEEEIHILMIHPWIHLGRQH